MRTHNDYLIIGAGPAGLQLGYFLQQNGRDHLILERANAPGSFFTHMPRHRQLISINKVHTGLDDPETSMRWDWNSLLSNTAKLRFSEYSKRYYPDADDLVRYLADFTRHFDLNTRFETNITGISKREDGTFLAVDDQGNNFVARRLIIATGLFKPFLPNIPGIELCDDYATHSIDPNAYTNKRVLVLGKGNSAFEVANHLMETAAVIHVCSPESVKFAWQTHYVGHLRSVNNDFLDSYQLKSQNAVIDGETLKIEKVGDKYRVHISYSHAKGQTAVIDYDNVIVCTGFHFDSSIFESNCRPELTLHSKFPAQSPAWESVNVPDMYFAGTLMQARDHKKTMSGFIHGFRYNVRALSHILELKYHGTSWPREVLEATPEAVLNKVLDRLNRSAGIFMQPGFLCDAVVIPEEGGSAEYFEDVARDYVHSDFPGNNPHYYTISLEYGETQDDPFRITRTPSPDKGYEAAYLHPVIRRYCFDRLVAEHHINDDLENEWRADCHVQPALTFFTAQLSPQQYSQNV